MLPGQPIVTALAGRRRFCSSCGGIAWSNQVSEQQFKDILGVLQVQAGKLDDAYLDRWAADLGVTDLLLHARDGKRCLIVGDSLRESL